MEMKRIAAALLGATVAAGFAAGCQSTQGNSVTSGTASPSGAASSSAAASSGAEPAGETETLKGWGASDFDGSTGISSYGQQIAWQEIEKELGIHVDWTCVSSANNNASTQFGLIMASGDLPDFFVDVSPMNLEEFGIKGALMPLETLIEEQIPALAQRLEEDPSIRGGITSADGHIYFLPRILGDVGTRCWPGWMIREDWLEQVGMQAPDTADDLYQVLRAFKEQIPGAEKPLSADPHPIIWAFGVGSRGPGNTTDDMFLEDGQIKFGPTDDRYRDAMQFIHQLYAEGLLDSEWNGITNDQLTTNVVTGMAGVSFGSFSGGLGKYNSLMAKDTGSEPLIAFKPLQGPSGVRATQGMHNSTDPGWAGGIASTTKKAETVARLFNYTYGEGRQACYFGIEGDTYTMVDGKPAYTEKVTTSELGTMNYVNNYIFNLSCFPSDYPLEVYHSILSEEGKRGNQITTENCGNIKVPSLRFTAEEISRVNSLLRDINSYVDENAAAFINGQKDIGEWDSYKAGYDSLGLEELLKIYNDAYARFTASAA